MDCEEPAGPTARWPGRWMIHSLGPGGEAGRPQGSWGALMQQIFTESLLYARLWSRH